MALVKCTLTLAVVYDIGDDKSFNPYSTLCEAIHFAAGSGLLTNESGTVSVDSYEIEGFVIKELE